MRGHPNTLLHFFVSSFTALMLLLGLCPPSYGAGGDILWQIGDARGGKQEAEAMAVDSLGNVIITGFHTISGSDNEYYTAKIKSDGTGTAWTASYNRSNGDDEAVAVAVDSNNDVIVSGYVWNGMNYDIHTIKYNGITGAVLWQNTFDGGAHGNDVATAIAVDGLNNVYIAGYSQNASGNEDYVVLKYSPAGPNPDGTPIRMAVYNGAANGVDRTTSIIAGGDGIAVTGYSWNGTDFDYVTIKYDFNLSQLWQKRYSSSGANNDKGLFVKMDASGNVVVTGSASNGTNLDIYTAKYDGSNGNIIREWTYNGGYDDEPRGLWIDLSGDIYITGYTWTLAGRYEFYTAKYNAAAGGVVWQSTFGSGGNNDDVAVATGILADESDNVFVTGYTYKAVEGNYDFQTLKYRKENGSLLWQQSFDGAAHKDDMPVGIGLTPSGEVVIAGWSDTWTAGSSDYDFYAIKYDPGLLNAPTQLSAEAVSNTEIKLSWSDNSPNEDGFKVERKIGENGKFAEITTIPYPLSANTTTYTDAGLDADTKYYYRIMAFNAANGNSRYSNEANAYTRIVPYSSPSWSYTFNGADNGDDIPYAIAVGPDNNPVVTGLSFSNAGSFDFYTVKFDRSNGNVLWNARYDGDQNDLDVAVAAAVDGNNGVLVSGYSSLYSPSAGQNTNDIYTIKYPATGPPEAWHDVYDGPSHNDDRSAAVATAVDGSNNFVVVGYGKNGVLPLIGNDDIYVIKYLPNGTRDWAATPYDGPAHGNDYPSAVAFDAAGNVFVIGYVHNGSDYDFFTAKYCGSATAPCSGKNKGQIIWSDMYDGAGHGNDSAKALAVDASGNVYVTGTVVNAAGNEDFLTIKYNGATGARMWERSYDGPAHGNDEARSVKIDPVDGDLVVAGSSLTETGNHDFVIIRYHANGAEVWPQPKILYRPANDDYVVDMGMDLSGNVCVAGTTSNGAATDMLSVKFNYEGTVIGATLYNGSAGSYDYTTAVAVNSLGEAFIAGYSRNASGNDDYVVYKCAWDSLQVPSPFTATSGYTSVALTWQDNSTSEQGFYIQRKVGACSSSNPWSTPPYSTAANTVTYTDSGLNIGTEYCYRIQAFGDKGTASRWIEKAATTLTPVAPGDPVAIAVNTTQINLSWTDNTTEEDGFKIERCAGSSCDFSVKDDFSTGPSVTNYQDTAACNSMTYAYRIMAYKSGQWESAPGVITATTPDPPTAPVLTVTRASEIQINLSWTYSPDDKTGFSIDRCTGTGCGFSDSSKVTFIVGAVNSYSDYAVLSGETYSYRIRAYKSTPYCSWDGGFSAPATASTTIKPPVVSATTPNTTEVNLSWTDNTSSETGFTIEKCESANCAYAPLATLGMNVTSFADTTVCASTAYKYRVSAFKNGLSSAGTGCWTKRAPLTITNFQANYETKLLINRTADMQGNFADLRFYDATTGYELPYWIEKIDTTVTPNQATVWLKTGGNNDIYMYYGNPDAASSSSAEAVFIRVIDQLKGAWSFDENTGLTANDKSGNGNNLSLISNPTWTIGKFGSAMSFNGSSTYARRPSGINLPLGNSNRTFMAWIKPAGYPDATYNGIVAYGGGCNGNGSMLSIRNDGGLSVAFWCNDAYDYSGAKATLNGWNHVAYTYDNTGIK